MFVSDAHEAGTVLGPYRLGTEIGRGPLGVVYRGTHESSGIPVALKVMSHELARNEAFCGRFLREAELGPKLTHPHIVSLLERAREGDHLFCASRLVEGEDLARLLAREGPLEAIRVLRIFRQIASALDAAHESGLVHQNLKPQNILLLHVPPGAPDVVYVSDFGMVRRPTSDSTVLRRAGRSSSLSYLSPEQIEGRGVDGRADVYSMGCLAFEALSGGLPFPHKKATDLMWAHVHGQPASLRDADPGLAHLELATGRALAKHPDDRYLTCGEFVDALEQAMAGRSRRNGALRLAGLSLPGRLR